MNRSQNQHYILQHTGQLNRKNRSLLKFKVILMVLTLLNLNTTTNCPITHQH